MDGIAVSTDELRAIGEKFVNLSEDMGDIIDESVSIKEELADTWESAAYDKFAEDWQEAADNLLPVVDLLLAVNERLQEIAQGYDDIDDQLAQ